MYVDYTGLAIAALALVGGVHGSPQTRKRQSASTYASEASTAIQELQKQYNQNSGLYGNNLWWNSANVITMLADFQEHFASSVSSITSNVFPNTLSKAPGAAGFPNFLNNYYDDEMWWCLAWIKVYDVTNDAKYLNQASVIFENAKSAFGNAPCGGLQWRKDGNENNAIENSLYLTAAAKLANRKPSTPSNYYYLNEATKAYNFMTSSGLINSQNLINDGLNAQSSSSSSCKNNNGVTWSYNQGAILGGLAELTWATGDSKYNNLAMSIATATINLLTDKNGILHDYACENSGCTGDGGQFKGVFARGVQFLVNRANPTAAQATLFKSFLQKNANAIWNSDRSGSDLGPVWSGPYQTTTVQDQSSALDAIIGAACVV